MINKREKTLTVSQLLVKKKGYILGMCVTLILILQTLNERFDKGCT